MTMQKQPEGMSRKARGEPVTHPQTGRPLPPEEYDIFDGKDKVGITRRAANGKGWHGLADGVPLPANELPPAFKTHGEAMAHIRDQRSKFPAAPAAETVQEPDTATLPPPSEPAPAAATDDADTVAVEGEVIQVILVDDLAAEVDVMLEGETGPPDEVPQHDAEPVIPEPQPGPPPQPEPVQQPEEPGDSDVQPDAYVDALAADTVPEYQPDEDVVIATEALDEQWTHETVVLEPREYPQEQSVADPVGTHAGDAGTEEGVHQAHPHHAHHAPKVTQAPEQATNEALAATDDWLLEPPKVEQEGEQVTAPATEDDRFPFA